MDDPFPKNNEDSGNIMMLKFRSGYIADEKASKDGSRMNIAVRMYS